MSKRVKETSAQESVEHVVSATEQFLESHKKSLLYGTIIVVLLVLIGLSYNQFYLKPLKKEAAEQMFLSERAFQEGNFEEALNGDGNALGFLRLLKEYKSKTPASIHFYIGVSQLHQGEYQEAIESLKKYKSKDPILEARAQANIGDGYASLGNYKEAINYYLKAARTADNLFTAGYLKKAAIMNEESGNLKEAMKLHKEILSSYPHTPEGIDAEKYIANLELKLSNGKSI